jgi:GTPase Era involved in 16S rRNA processing
MSAGEATVISLSLVSHTNVGKTTLARTLLARDIGQVRDEAHVTETAEAEVLIDTPEGDRLLLWDTPGFGDSLRLARRMAQAGSPIGWFLTEVWDRWRDRAFWSSQRALKHVWEQCDVVLYLVDASQAPQDVGYLDAELQVLALTGKPAIVLLNQLGAPGQAEEAALEARWRERLKDASGIRAVLPLDAFSRCWVQEGVLWQAVAPLLPEAQRPAFERLRAAWHERQAERWRESMAELARRLARAARDVQTVEADGWRGSVRSIGSRLGRALGLRDDDSSADAPLESTPGRSQVDSSPSGGLTRSGRSGGAIDRAMAQLAERLDNDVKRSTDVLIRLHGLDGRAGEEVLGKLARHYAVTQPLDEGRAAIWGGLVTGALAGLKADIASGGLTLGGGLLAGGVIGALGAAGAARGVNVMRGVSQPQVRWDPRVLDALFASALLGYLAVAHHGRGRGAWVAQEPPPTWVAAVAAAMGEQRDALAGLWASARQGAAPGDAATLRTAQAAMVLEAASASVLRRLYPDATGSQPAASIASS